MRCVCLNINAIARTHTWKTMLPARCNLCAAACGILCRRPAQAAAQAAARKLQRAGRMVLYVCIRAIAFIFIHKQHASEIAGNSVALLVEIQRECPAPLRRSVRVPFAFRLRSARVPSALRSRSVCVPSTMN